MLRSMYSGISGLRNFQTKLDVIGNNIANVNTMGFKKGRVVFKDVISQTMAGASAPGVDRGGVNPKQIGLGSQISVIDTLHSPGSPASTGQTLDLAISGDGFFQVMDGIEVMYTRAGNFYMDRNGNLVDGDGRYVVGADGIINIPPSASSMSIGQDGTVFFVDLTAAARANITAAEATFATAETDFTTAKTTYEGITGTPSQAQEDAWQLAQDNYKAAQAALAQVKADNPATLQEAGQIQMVIFANPGGLDKTGGNLYRATANSGDAVTGFALDQGFGAVESGYLEMSNVDLSEEFTEMIIAQRGFQANTRIITTSDEILQELVNLKR